MENKIDLKQFQAIKNIQNSGFFARCEAVFVKYYMYLLLRYFLYYFD